VAAPGHRLVAATLCLAALAAHARSDMICSDFEGRTNCMGKPRQLHGGLDFGAPFGTEVISATHGTFVDRTYSDCPGHGFVIRTDIRSQHGDFKGPVYAYYVHAEALPHLKKGDKIKPGDPVGKIIILRGTPCYASREHVHYELRVGTSSRRYIDPHAFWVDGPGKDKTTCFREGMTVPPGKAVAPLRCR
jgi:murein DD-endopeptidase MepM/ murein hydrolase activator NlpD